MKRIRVEDAEGLALGYDLTKIVPGQFKGAAFKKGHVIRKEDIEELKSMGKNHIYIVEPQSGEIHENEAAERIAKAAAGENIYTSGPGEGKIEFKAKVRGIVKVNAEVLYEINSLGEISLASIHTNTPVEKDQPVAATRAIPLMVSEKKLELVEKICRNTKGPVISVKAMKPERVGIIVTGTEVFEGRIQDRFALAMKEKIKYYGCTAGEVRFVPDDAERITEEIKRAAGRGDRIVLVCGGMSVDADDMTPEAIARASDTVVSYGIPAIPGNMLMIAYLNDCAIIGIPGAAIYFGTTSLDLILPRILCGEKLNLRDVASYGHGGYCFRCDSCVYPACPFGKG